MRMLKRFVLMWLLMTPLAYYFGLPYLTEMTQTKLRAQNYDSCQRQVAVYGAQVTPIQAQRYCACINEALVLTGPDVLAMAGTKKLPPALEASIQEQVDICTPVLEETPAEQAPPAVKKRGEPERKPDGSIEIFL